MRKRTLIAFAFLATLLVGCTNSTSTNSESDRLNVLCTTQIISDVLQHFVGDSADVNYLMGPGIDPHIYTPSFKDLSLLESADVIVYNGLHLEGKMQEILEGYSSEKTVISVAKFLEEDKRIVLDEEPVVYDPHVWFNPDNFVNCIQSIADEINATFKLETSDDKGKAFMARKDSLTQVWKDLLDGKPKKKRILVTAHDAFSYFGDYFGIEVKALQGINTQAEYGVKDVKELASFIIENDVKAIFLESAISSRSVESVIREVENQGHSITMGSTLYADAMGIKGSGADEYLMMIDHNVRNIIQGMGDGTAE